MTPAWDGLLFLIGQASVLFLLLGLAIVFAKQKLATFDDVRFARSQTMNYEKLIQIVSGAQNNDDCRSIVDLLCQVSGQRVFGWRLENDRANLEE